MNLSLILVIGFVAVLGFLAFNNSKKVSKEVEELNKKKNNSISCISVLVSSTKVLVRIARHS